MAFNLIFSSGLTSFGIDALLLVGEDFFGRSLIWPTLDSTIKSLPRYLDIVLAFAVGLDEEAEEVHGQSILGSRL